MKHKKTKHGDTILPCEKFLKGECSREESCWFKHISAPSNTTSPSHEQVFRKVPGNPFPPDQLSNVVQMITSLCLKVENMEKTIQQLKK